MGHVVNTLHRTIHKFVHWRRNPCHVWAICCNDWIQTLFISLFLIFISNSCLFSGPVYSLRTTEVFNKDGWMLAFISLRADDFSLLIFTRPPGQTYSVHFSTSLRWTLAVQRSGISDPLKLFTQLNHRPGWSDMQSLCCKDRAVLEFQGQDKARVQWEGLYYWQLKYHYRGNSAVSQSSAVQVCSSVTLQGWNAFVKYQYLHSSLDLNVKCNQHFWMLNTTVRLLASVPGCCSAAP